MNLPFWRRSCRLAVGLGTAGFRLLGRGACPGPPQRRHLYQAVNSLHHCAYSCDCGAGTSHPSRGSPGATEARSSGEAMIDASLDDAGVLVKTASELLLKVICPGSGGCCPASLCAVARGLVADAGITRRGPSRVRAGDRAFRKSCLGRAPGGHEDGCRHSALGECPTSTILWAGFEVKEPILTERARTDEEAVALAVGGRRRGGVRGRRVPRPCGARRLHPVRRRSVALIRMSG